MEPITIEDPQARSKDVVAENLDRLEALFPEAFVEGSVDFEVLKQLLGSAVDERDEKYGLTWHGKRQARQLALTPSNGTLRPCPDDSLDWETTQNLMIEGDNLEVLKLMQKSYAGKVKLIYIDPPYNTGKQFVYPDNLQDNIKNYLEVTGQVDGGRKVSSNVETSGRFHTDWLNMMYPRLKLARTLLSGDGVIFISIDDNEVDNLRKICDEIFGEENRVAIICHKSRASVSNDKIISSNHNFLLLYARDGAKIFEHRALFGLEPDLSGFDKDDERGAFKYAPVDGPGGAAKGNPHYTFMGVTGYFRFSEERMQQMYDEGRVVKVGKGLQQKHYLEDAKAARRADTTWWDEKFYTATASTRLKEMMGADVFDNPKPVELIQKMLELWVREANDTVVDFFAGSGTTGDAVLRQSARDNIARRYLLVELPGLLDSENKDQKAAAEYCDSIGKPQNLAELTKERLRRAAIKVKESNPTFEGDVGFRVFRLDSSNISAWDPDRDDLPKTLEQSLVHLKPDRTEADILYELLLKLGIDLCVPIETKTIGGKPLESIGGGVLFVCLAEQISSEEVEALAQGIVAWHEKLAPAGDTTCVFRDSAFVDDVAKTNLAAILSQHGLANVRSL